MKTRRRKPAAKENIFEPIWWLPIDSRLFPGEFSFRHVRGTARWFLQLELTLAGLIVLGSITIVLLKLALRFLE